MIQGFRLKFTSDELKTHLRDRVDHHEGRAITKESELPALRSAAEKLKVSIEAPARASDKFGSSNGSGPDVNSAIENLEDQVRDHRNKAAVFRLFADHLFAEDYDLTENDLFRLEFLKR